MSQKPRTSETDEAAPSAEIKYQGMPIPKDTRHPQAIDIRRATYETAVNALGNVLSEISGTPPETPAPTKTTRPLWSTEAREFLSSYERPSDPEKICKSMYDRLIALKAARTSTYSSMEPTKVPQLHVEDILLLVHMIFSFDDKADLEMHAAEYPLKLFVFALASYAHRVFHDDVDKYPYEEFKRNVIAELKSMETMPKHRGMYRIEGEPDEPQKAKQGSEHSKDLDFPPD